MLTLDMWYNQDSPGSQPPPAWSACLLVIWLSHFRALSLDFLQREGKDPGDEASLKAVLRAGHTQLIRDYLLNPHLFPCLVARKPVLGAASQQDVSARFDKGSYVQAS